MANKIILKPQQLSAYDYAKIKIPPGGGGGGTFKKIFFQCQIQDFRDGDPVIGLIAYAGFTGPKRIGPEYKLSDVPGGQERMESNLPIAFANLELAGHNLEPFSQKKEEGYIIRELEKHTKGIETEKDLEVHREKLTAIKVVFSPDISKNPHVYYNVDLAGTTEATNPSPPAPPSDY